MNNWSSIRSEHDIFSDTGRAGPHTQVRHHVWSGLKAVRLWRDTTAAEQTAGAPARTPYNDCLHYCLPGVPDIYLQRPARAGTADAGCPCILPDAPARAGGLRPQHRVTRPGPPAPRPQMFWEHAWHRDGCDYALCSVLSSCTQSDLTAGS